MSRKLLNVVLMASLVSIAGMANESNLDETGKGGGFFRPAPRPHGGVTVRPTPKPTFPVGIKPTFPVGIKPMPPMKPPVVIGIIKPPVKPPIIVGIIKPPVKPPVIIGIIKPPVKPPVIIGIIKPPKPPVIGIVIPKPPHKPHWPTWPHNPHHPHYPHYPHWPHRPHCPPYVVGGIYTPIVISQPYPVTVPVEQGQMVLNLQCALPESVQAQDLSTINVNLIARTDDYQVVGTLNDAANAPFNVSTVAMGTIDEQMVSLKLPQADEVYLEAVDYEGTKYYQGTIRLLGRSDKSGLVCQLTVLEQ